MRVETADTYMEAGLKGGRVTAEMIRFHEDEQGNPAGTQKIELALSPVEARAIATALTLAAMAADMRAQKGGGS